MAGVLLLMTLGTAFHWLIAYVPAMLAGRTPQEVRDSGLVTAPVAVLDLAFMAPASIIAAILLLRRRPLGFVLGPVLLTFLALGSLVLGVIGIVMALRGFETGWALVAIGAALAAVAAILLALSLRGGQPALE
jgi:hypothetical protein